MCFPAVLWSSSRQLPPDRPEYRDAATLCSNIATDIKAWLNVFKEEVSKLSLEVHWEKTKVMHIGDGPNPLPINISIAVVEFISSFNYLGSIIMNTGNIWQHK